MDKNKELIEQTLSELFEPAIGYSNINKQLLFEIFLPPDEKLKKEAFVLLGLWSYPINFDCYTEFYFPDMMFECCQSENIDPMNSDKYSKFRNHLVKLEFESIKERLLELKEIFNRYNFPTNKQAIRAFLDKGKLEPENESFLRILKTENLEVHVLEPLIKKRLVEIGKMDLFYILSVIYLDLYKIYQFLIKKYDQSIPDCATSENITSKNRISFDPQESIPEGSKIFNTVWEAVLYHSAISDKYPKEARSKKEMPELVKNWYKPDGETISPNSFYNKLRNINEARTGNQTKEGKYTCKDYEAVAERLSKEHPEVLEKLREMYFYNELY